MHERSSPVRKLSAILAADAAGYSRLMAQDESTTLAALNDARAVFREQIEARHGRTLDTAGDSVLAEFASPVEAVRAAISVQDRLGKINAPLPEERRMRFRIGVNLGDVIEEGGTLYGDGVNVAARLQELAEPGGLCISGTVFDQVEGKLPFAFESIGEQSVKNIPKPVRAYHLLPQNEADRASTRASPARRRAVVAATLLTVAFGGIFVWYQTRAPAVPSPSKATPSETHDPALAMPTGPVIAVLPFTNMSGDPKEDYFSDGLTEDIITNLAYEKDIYVLARNSTFKYKGQAVDVRRVGKELGAGYILEGSVRRNKDKIRVTAQLIDAATGSHIWAAKYDRDYRDVFAIQDELAGRVIGAIAGGVGGAMLQATSRSQRITRPEDMRAFDLYLQSKAIFLTPDGFPKARELLARAIRLEPGFGRAQQDYAWHSLAGWIFHLGDVGMTKEEVFQNAIRSVELDPSSAYAHRTAAFAYYFDRQLDSFRKEARIAFDLAPYNPEIFAQLAFLIGVTGEWDRAVKLATKAYSLNPVTAGGWYHSTLFYYHYTNRRYQDALDIMKQHTNPSLCENQMKFIIAYAQLGQSELGRPHYEACQKAVPDFSPEWMAGTFRMWSFREQDIALFMDGFAKAGYPCRRPDCRAAP